jgi:hypothetical protein
MVIDARTGVAIQDCRKWDSRSDIKRNVVLFGNGSCFGKYLHMLTRNPPSSNGTG